MRIIGKTARVSAAAYSSVALTGRGHCTDRAILLGLGDGGRTPDHLTRAAAHRGAKRLRCSASTKLNSTSHEPAQTGSVCRALQGMRFTAHDAAQKVLAREEYYSIGGGFVLRAGAEMNAGAARGAAPFEFGSGEQLLELSKAQGLEIHELILARERTWRSDAEVQAGLTRIWQVMQDCARRGFDAQGLLPGVLGVRRRAPKLYRQLTSGDPLSPMHALDWVNAYALAVNRENAAGGQVSPRPQRRRRHRPAVLLLSPLRGGRGRQRCGALSTDGRRDWRALQANASISEQKWGCQG